MSMCDEELQLSAMNPTADGVADSTDDQIARQIMRILREHSPPTSARCLSAETETTDRLGIQPDRFADLTQAIVRLVRQVDHIRSTSPYSNQLAYDVDIIETIPVPEIIGQQFLQVSPTLRRSTSNLGSVSSRSGYNIESANPFKAADATDELDAAFEGKARDVGPTVIRVRINVCL